MEGAPPRLDGAETTVRLERAAVALAWPMLCALLLGILLVRAEPLALAGLFGVAAVGVRLAQHERPRRWWATAVTSVRVVLTAALAMSSERLSGPLVAATICGILALDGVDGAIARRTQSVSRIGGQLDTEADAFLCAVVCLLSWLQVGSAWLLVGGFLRYGYVLLVRLLPSRGPVPRNRFAARAFGLAILGFAAGFLELGAASVAFPALATALLAWSFGRSFYWSFTRGAVGARS
ncbi:MAG TPA: CDP-alcohol phosphatidyltransferase family protein [Polyangiaceae bacterium]